MSHTPEPWKEVEYNDYELTQTGSIRGANNQCVVSPRQGVVGRNLEESEANAARIVAYVNGCAGLNPAAYRECIKTLTILAQSFEAIPMGGDIANPVILVKSIRQVLAHGEDEP